MRTAVRTLLTVTLAACILSPLTAGESDKAKKRDVKKTEAKKDDAKKKNAKKRPAKRTVLAVRVPKTLELTDEQKSQLEAINKEFGPKLAEIQKTFAGILTDEQKKARTEAFKKARESKLKGKEARKALEDAVQLTDEQKKQMKETQMAMAAIRKEAMTKFFAILTPEQQKQAKPTLKPGAKKKPAKTDAKKTE